MTWFPFNYRDVKAFQNDNLYLSTTSNETAKLYDSAITQLAMHDNDPLYGTFEETLAKMMQSDPDFVMGKVMALSLQMFAESPRKNTKLVYDVNNFADRALKRNPSSW